MGATRAARAVRGRDEALAAFHAEGCSADRLDLEPGTEHAATVGPEGVGCVEASR